MASSISVNSHWRKLCLPQWSLNYLLLQIFSDSCGIRWYADATSSLMSCEMTWVIIPKCGWPIHRILLLHAAGVCDNESSSLSIFYPACIQRSNDVKKESKIDLWPSLKPKARNTSASSIFTWKHLSATIFVMKSFASIIRSENREVGK